jgi:hypothetical protein
VAAPIAINCTARGTEFKATLLQKGACSPPAVVQCPQEAPQNPALTSQQQFWDDAVAFCGRPCSADSQQLRVPRQVRWRCSATQRARTPTRRAASGRCTAVRPDRSEWTHACARRRSSRASSTGTVVRCVPRARALTIINSGNQHTHE